jgi:hypothetical protein
MSDRSRVPLYERLPEIYRTKDKELPAPDQLRSYLALVEDAFSEIHENIEELYHDLFIETSNDWVIPYIGDLLGTSHLSGDPWTLRADVADTIALRRRKGTLGAIELLTYNLTRWGVHCVELRENMVWNQHLNHQRPDEGGQPPYSLPTVKRQTPIRGGTMNLRAPAVLALLGTPFDPFAYTADVKPPALGNIRYNLPNLAIFLWRLAAYRIRVTRPIPKGVTPTGLAAPAAAFVARFNINPIERPYVPPATEKERQRLQLFNTHRFDLFNNKRTGRDKLDTSSTRPQITLADEVSGPILLQRLSEGEPGGAPEKYVSVETYDATTANLTGLELSDVGFQLHLPEAMFAGETWPIAAGPTFAWKIRGANLCAWEDGLQPRLRNKEIAIDPVIGRVVIGVNTPTRANSLGADMLVTVTYGAVGPVGAHPTSRRPLPDKFNIPQPSPNFRRVSLRQNPNGLRDALNNIHLETAPVVIEIEDSFTHVLDLAAIAGTVIEDGGRNLRLNSSLLIRAASEQRPVIKLMQPLRVRPAKVVATPPTDTQQQKDLDAAISQMTLRLEGLFLTRGESYPAAEEALVARAAVNSLEIIDCTLDPGGFVQIDEARAPIRNSMRLREPYGFLTDPSEEEVFDQTPEIVLFRTITGPLLIDAGYRISLTDSIVDAGQGVADTTPKLAIGAATNSATAWGPPTTFSGLTVFGRTRVQSIAGSGAIFVHALEDRDVQKGCVKFSYFSGEPADRLPQNHGCVKGITSVKTDEARLRFTSEFFGHPAYGQLSGTADFRIRERGPSDDAMGAFGFLLEAHKWRNLQIRFREFMPVGVRPLLIPAT